MKSLILLTLFMISQSLLGQTKSDKMYLLDGVKEVNIEEVGTNTIKYRNLNENTSYVISKHQVKKIMFSSGREEVFETPFKPVDSFNDFENVYITYIPQDIDGLSSKGEVYSKAAGVTALSSINNVKNRAVKKVKMEAAMLGANVILMGNTFQRGNQFGNEYTPAVTTMTTLSGTAYSSEKLDVNSLLVMAQNYRYNLYQINRLNRNAWDSQSDIVINTDKDGNILLINFDEAFIRDGELFVKSNDLKTRSKELKVIRGDEESITLMERDGKRISNYFLLSEKEDRVRIGIEIMEQRKGK